MTQQRQTAKEVWAPEGNIPPRRDKVTAAIVKKGITLQQIHGTRYAAEFLKEKKVDIEIVMRVLLNMSEQRRHDDLLELQEDRFDVEARTV